jgi:outer membrane lipase/esterase
MGPRLLRDAFCDAAKDPKIARLPLQAISERSRKMRTLKRTTVAVLAMLALGAGTTLADTEHDYSRIFIFGASFMDSGNHFALTGETAHPPFELINYAGYGVGGHRPTNGHTWVEVLAQDMKLTEWAKPAYRDSAYGNYAVAYGRATDVLPDPVEPSLYDQVTQWINNGYCTGGPTSPMNDTLFIVDSGYADALDLLDGHDPVAVLSGMTSGVADNLYRLHACGARNVLFAYTAPLEKSPIVPEDPTQPSLSAIYNYLFLQPVVAGYSGEPFNMNISTVDFFAFISTMLNSPDVYGLTNVTETCITPYVTRGAFCKNRDEYFFWDALHPTKKVHALLAEFALGQLP